MKNLLSCIFTNSNKCYFQNRFNYIHIKLYHYKKYT